MSGFVSFYTGLISQIWKILLEIAKAIGENIKGDNELKVRIKTAAVFGFLFLILLFSGGFFTNLLFLLISIAVFYEFCNIISINKGNKDLYSKQIILATIYSVVPFASILSINATRNGNSLIFWFFCIIWATDCGAYFTGKYFGGRKLIPNISPGKTVSGAVGGTLCAFVTGFLLSFLCINTQIANLSMMSFGFVGILISISAQISDAIESFIKRKFNIKDTGNILPGHGGVMDRMDSVTLSAPLFLFIINKLGF